MKISFKTSDDKLSCEIFYDDKPIGNVKLDIFKGTWKLDPTFKVPPAYALDAKKYFDSSYNAGKELVRIYSTVSWLPDMDEDYGDFGFSLDEVLTFLKTGD